MTDFELTSPRPDQTPQTATQANAPSSRMFEWHDIVEKTVQAVVSDPSGRRSTDVQAVIVFTDGTWITLGAQGGSDDEAGYIDLGNSWMTGEGHQLHDYLNAREIFDTGLINEGQYQFMQAREAEQRAKDNAARAARLRAEAERLEGGAA